MKSGRIKTHLLLHSVVLIFGFTGILGKLISITSEGIVFYRMAIGAFGLLITMLLSRITLKASKQTLIQYFLVALLIVLHWYCFFESIKQSTVSIALASLASTSLFISLLEPLINRKKIQWFEMGLGLLVIVGLFMIFTYELNYTYGIVLGLLAAIFAALFSIFNSRLVAKHPAEQISFYELFMGALICALYMISLDQPELGFIIPSLNELLWIILLGTVATAFAFVSIIRILKILKPFSVSLAINMEPLYGILLAYFIFGEDEKMTPAFYAGTIIIVISIYLDVWYRKFVLAKSKGRK